MADPGLRGFLGRALLGMERAARRARLRYAPPRRFAVQPPTKIPSSPPGPDQVTTRAPRADVQSSHPEYGVSIGTINAASRQAEEGLPYTLFDLYDGERRFDGHLRGVCEARALPVASANYVLIPGDTKARSRRAADDLTMFFRRAGGRAWLKHQQSHAFYGPAVSETIWDLIDSKVAPSRFVHVPHRRLASPSISEPDAIGIVNGPILGRTPIAIGRGMVEPIAAHPGRFSVTQYELGSPWLCGLFFTTMWWAAFKRWGWRDWQVFAEMFGLPLRVGYYEEGASEATRAALSAAVEAIGTDGYAVLSELCELVVKNEARSGDAKGVYDSQIAICEAQMSKVIVGATLAHDAGGNGSYAQAGIHADQGFYRCVADAGQIGETFQRDIATPFVAWNDYGGAAPPIMVLQVVRPTSLDSRAQHLLALSQAFPKMRFDEDQVREEFSLRTPPDGEGLTGPEVPAKTPPPPPGGTDG
jgi:hypothetical protein